MTDEDLYEALVLWRAYQALLERMDPDIDARTSDPAALPQLVAGYGHTRAYAAIFADGMTSSLGGGARVLDELLTLASAGRRPRWGTEIHPQFVDLIITPEGAVT